jgi:hypothetical protein
VSTPPRTEADWTAGERRERRLEGLLALVGLTVLVGWALLRLDLGSGSGRAWLTGGALASLLGLVVWVGSAGWRARKGSFRIRYAVRRHLDPGPEFRKAADAFAEQTAIGSWVIWLQPVIWAPQVVGGRWEEPGVAVPGLLLLVIGLVGVIVWNRRMAAASRRWLDDPPGPARAGGWLPPPERPWTVTGRQAVLLVVLVGLVGVATVAAALAFV